METKTNNTQKTEQKVIDRAELARRYGVDPSMFDRADKANVETLRATGKQDFAVLMRMGKHAKGVNPAAITAFKTIERGGAEANGRKSYDSFHKKVVNYCEEHNLAKPADNLTLAELDAHFAQAKSDVAFADIVRPVSG